MSCLASETVVTLDSWVAPCGWVAGRGNPMLRNDERTVGAQNAEAGDDAGTAMASPLAWHTR
jgi:hypothetical protein